MYIVVLAGSNREVLDDSNACAAQDQHHMSDRFEISRSPAAISKNSATSES
jgi:hypothetical protein